MDRTEFVAWLQERRRVCDGPLGQILQDSHVRNQAGSGAAALPELLALEEFARLRELHESAREAGADLLLTNTLAANRPSLAPLKLASKLAGIVNESIRAAREAAGEGSPDGAAPPRVGFTLGPLAPGVAPCG